MIMQDDPFYFYYSIVMTILVAIYMAVTTIMLSDSRKLELFKQCVTVTKNPDVCNRIIEKSHE